MLFVPSKRTGPTSIERRVSELRSLRRLMAEKIPQLLDLNLLPALMVRARAGQANG
jgi:hypothetical protein